MIKNIIVAATILFATISPAQADMSKVSESDQPPIPSYHATFNTKSADPVSIVAPAKPNYDKEVLVPLRAAQKKAADEAAAAAAKAKADADAAAAAQAAQAAQQAQQAQQQATANTQVYGGNLYAYGYCTWYVASRRTVPSNWGNAGQWYGNAQSAGWSTGSAPRAGAIGVSFNGSYGHVVYIESVNSNGTVNVSEMNSTNGWGNVDYATYSASNYVYIY